MLRIRGTDEVYLTSQDCLGFFLKSRGGLDFSPRDALPKVYAAEEYSVLGYGSRAIKFLKFRSPLTVQQSMFSLLVNIIR